MSDLHISWGDDVINSLPQSLIAIDLQGYVRLMNRASKEAYQETCKEASIEESIDNNFQQETCIHKSASSDIHFLDHLHLFIKGNESITEQLIQQLTAMLNGDLSHNYPLEYTFYNRCILVETIPLLEEGIGPIKGIIILQTDITQRKELELEAVTQINIFEGLLPICAVCKKIKDEQRIWTPIEIYLSHHTSVEFTHDICPDCIRQLYPKYSSVFDKNHPYD